jgi:AAA lid domain
VVSGRGREKTGWPEVRGVRLSVDRGPVLNDAQRRLDGIHDGIDKKALTVAAGDVTVADVENVGAHVEEKSWRAEIELRAGSDDVYGEKLSFLVYETPDDIKRIALPALRHRIALTPDALLEGRTANDLLAEAIETVAAPRL